MSNSHTGGGHGRNFSLPGIGGGKTLLQQSGATIISQNAYAGQAGYP
jgi:hypothetical protein